MKQGSRQDELGQLQFEIKTQDGKVLHVKDCKQGASVTVLSKQKYAISKNGGNRESVDSLEAAVSIFSVEVREKVRNALGLFGSDYKATERQLRILFGDIKIEHKSSRQPPA